MENKQCPKCPDSIMIAADYIGVVPAQLDQKYGTQTVSSNDGIPVAMYECPNCHLVELYHSPPKEPF